MTTIVGEWDFPSNNNGEKTGISEAGIETFRGNLFSSLAREICQNSMDAKYEPDKPVHIEFQLSQVQRDSILGVQTLADTIERCCTFWAVEHDKKAVEFFDKAKKVIANNTVPVLRISDFNTEGVKGAKILQNSPWQNLVKSAGVSNKSGDSGGSFGIGKSAPYAVSQLRTIFYSTYDSEEVRAYQGVSKLATFFNKKGETTQGKGYFGDAENNSPILGSNFPFGDYARQQTGTDIFILGFQQHSDWEDEILKAVIDGYLISITMGALTVAVGNIKLTKETIGEYLFKYKEHLPLTYQYYEVLTNDSSSWITLDVDGMQHISLKLGAKDGYDRKILMARSNGMKIFDQNRFPAFFDFVGICILNDEVNSYFRAMENPQHTKWESDRFSDEPSERKVAEKRRKALRTLLSTQVKQLAETEIADEMDAVGAGEFIPALDDSEMADENKKESINDKVAGYTKIEQVEYKQNVKGSQKILEHEALEPVDSEEGDSPLNGWGGTDGDFKGKNDSKNTGIPNPNAPNSSGGAPTSSNGETQDKVVTFVPLKVRMFLKNAGFQLYTLSFIPQYSATNATIAIYIVGEQGRSEAILKNALDLSLNEFQLDGNKIAIGTLTANKKTSCYFSLKTKGQFSMEVEVNGYQA